MFYNCFPPHDSVIKIPTRQKLMPAMEALIPSIVGTVYTVNEIVSIISNHIGRSFNVNVLHSTSTFVLPNDMDVNAFYDQELDENQKPPIELVLVTFPADKVLVWTEDEYIRVANRIVDSVVHEIVHLVQARTRQFVDYASLSPLPTTEKEAAQQYLGTADEIDAYAHNIADELLDFSTLVSRTNWLSNPSTIPLDISPNLWGYINTFDHNIDHPVVRRLLKKVWKHYHSR